MIFVIMGWTGLWGIVQEGREGSCLNCDFCDYGMDRILYAKDGARRELVAAASRSEDSSAKGLVEPILEGY